MQYVRGDGSLVIERLVPEDRMAEEGEEDQFLSAYQMIKQHADLEVQEPVDAPLEAVARAVQSLTSRKYRLVMFVVENRDVIRSWLGKDFRIEDIWQVPLVEDPDAHEPGFFVCGSRTGTLVRDIETAVFCRME